MTGRNDTVTHVNKFKSEEKKKKKIFDQVTHSFLISKLSKIGAADFLVVGQFSDNSHSGYQIDYFLLWQA